MTTGVLEVVDHATVNTSGSLDVGKGSNSWGYVTLSGFKGEYCVHNENGSAEMKLLDSTEERIILKK